MDAINLDQSFSQVTEHWRPFVAASVNGQEVKLAKAQGVLPWHSHSASDEMFLVWKGRLRVDYRDRTVNAGQGEFVVIPRGVEHRITADDEAEVLIFEPAEVSNIAGALYEGVAAPGALNV